MSSGRSQSGLLLLLLQPSELPLPIRKSHLQVQCEVAPCMFPLDVVQVSENALHVPLVLALHCECYELGEELLQVCRYVLVGGIFEELPDNCFLFASVKIGQQGHQNATKVEIAEVVEERDGSEDSLENLFKPVCVEGAMLGHLKQQVNGSLLHVPFVDMG